MGILDSLRGKKEELQEQKAESEGAPRGVVGAVHRKYQDWRVKREAEKAIYKEAYTEAYDKAREKNIVEKAKADAMAAARPTGQKIREGFQAAKKYKEDIVPASQWFLGINPRRYRHGKQKVIYQGQSPTMQQQPTQQPKISSQELFFGTPQMHKKRGNVPDAKRLFFGGKGQLSIPSLIAGFITLIMLAVLMPDIVTYSVNLSNTPNMPTAGSIFALLIPVVIIAVFVASLVLYGREAIYRQ